MVPEAKRGEKCEDKDKGKRKKNIVTLETMGCTMYDGGCKILKERKIPKNF